MLNLNYVLACVVFLHLSSFQESEGTEQLVDGKPICVAESETTLIFDLQKYPDPILAQLNWNDKLLATVIPPDRILEEDAFKSKIKVEVKERFVLKLHLRNITASDEGAYTCRTNINNGQQLEDKTMVYYDDGHDEDEKKENITSFVEVVNGGCRNLTCLPSSRESFIKDDFTGSESNESSLLTCKDSFSFSCCTRTNSRCKRSICKPIEIPHEKSTEENEKSDNKGTTRKPREYHETTESILDKTDMSKTKLNHRSSYEREFFAVLAIAIIAFITAITSSLVLVIVIKHSKLAPCSKRTNEPTNHKDQRKAASLQTRECDSKLLPKDLEVSVEQQCDKETMTDSGIGSMQQTV